MALNVMLFFAIHLLNLFFITLLFLVLLAPCDLVARFKRHPSALVAWVITHLCLAVFRKEMAALMPSYPGVAFRAVSGYRRIYKADLLRLLSCPVVPSPSGACPSSASRLLRVPMAFGCLLTTAWVPLTSFDIYPGNITSVHDVNDLFSVGRGYAATPLSFHLVEGVGFEPHVTRR